MNNSHETFVHHVNAEETLRSAGINVRDLVERYGTDGNLDAYTAYEGMVFIQLQLMSAQVEALLSIDEHLAHISLSLAVTAMQSEQS